MAESKVETGEEQEETLSLEELGASGDALRCFLKAAYPVPQPPSELETKLKALADAVPETEAITLEAASAYAYECLFSSKCTDPAIAWRWVDEYLASKSKESSYTQRVRRKLGMQGIAYHHYNLLYAAFHLQDSSPQEPSEGEEPEMPRGPRYEGTPCTKWQPKKIVQVTRFKEGAKPPEPPRVDPHLCFGVSTDPTEGDGASVADPGSCLEGRISSPDHHPLTE